jgi:cell wall-associated NlpC family hydrolase
MRLKLLFIVLALLLTSTIESKNKESNSESEHVVNAPINTIRTELVEFAKNLIGTPYRYASSNPVKGFDCSGFVNYVFKKYNINVPRSSVSFGSIGKALQPEDFKVGDVLVFYGYKDKTRIGHVGIICEAAGMKSKFIHASSGKEYQVTISELGSEMYTRRFYKCVDVID